MVMRSIQPQLWRIPRWAQELHKLTIRSLQASATMLQLPVSDVAVCRPMSSKSSSSSSSSSSMSSSSVLQSSPQISLSALKSAQTTNSPLVGDVDRHNGITVDLGQLPVNFADSDFSRILEESLDIWREEGRAAIWLSIPIEQSHLIPCAAAQGFQFHHAEGSHSMMKLWLRDDKPDLTPRFATHQVGVSGIVIREETRELLVVQDKNRPHTLWKFPGGLANLGEDIDFTAVREVLEETGVKTEFQSILAFRQQHNQPGAFGRSDLFVLCRLRPLTFELKPCSEEIRHCRWMTVEELRAQVGNVSSMTVRLTDLVLRGLAEGFEHVDIQLEQHRSLYRGMTFKMFFRPLGAWMTK